MEKRTAMNKELKAKYDAFKTSCGNECHFRMVLSYVMDKGFDVISKITEADIASMVVGLKEEEKNSRGFLIMTPEFQGWLVEQATQLIKIGEARDLLKYIQNEIWLG